jgi:titin
MSFASLLHRLRRSSGTTDRARRPGPQTTTSRRAFRPRLEVLEDRLAPAVFTVSNTNDSGAGSLRQAILSANATPGSNTINFSIGSGGQAIFPTSQLPFLTNPVVLDATTQPGFSGTPLIDLSGLFAGPNANGLVLSAGNSTVKGLTVSVFSGSGIVLFGSGGDVISGNYLGTSRAGDASAANGFAGLAVVGTAANQILNNVISGNSTFGVDLVGSAGNVIAGNLIGANAADSAAVANAYAGVALTAGSTGNVVAYNILSGNTGFGLLLCDAGTANNLIATNDIGLSVAGMALANGYGVVVASGASGNTVGGSTAGLRNYISGNTYDGVVLSGAGTSGNVILGDYIGTNQAGTAAIANGLNNVVIQDGASGNAVGGDLVSGAGQFGVLVIGTGTNGNAVGSSFIGTTFDGNSSLSNGLGGVNILAGASGNLVANNVLGAALLAEVHISDAGTTGNVIQANFLGTNPADSVFFRSGNDVLIESGATANLVGGSTRALGNVIDGANVAGVYLVNAGTTGNIVENNLIGTNPAGTAALNGNGTGIVIIAPGNLIASNVISGNTVGVEVEPGVTGNVLAGNLIGTNAAGTAAVPNTFEGVQIRGPGNIVGGTTAAARNVISGNGRYGVLISGGNNNLVEGNFIGTKADGVSPLGNGTSGIFAGVFVTGSIFSGATGNIIGGTAAGAGNVIAFSTGAGVLIGSDPTGPFTTPAGTGNSVLGNSIFGNARIGIDLGPDDGVTANDSAGHTGPNNFQNYPVLTQAMVSGNSLVVTGTLSTPFAGTIRVEFFANASADPSGNGQGKIFLGYTTVSISSGLTSAFVAVLADPMASGQVISATATDASGNTSEFSADVVAK